MERLFKAKVRARVSIYSTQNTPLEFGKRGKKVNATLLPRTFRGLKPQNFEKIHGTTKAKELSSCFLSQKKVYVHKLYNFCLEPLRLGGFVVVLPFTRHK